MITIDGKTYEEKDLNDLQKTVVNILVPILNQRDNLSVQLDQTQVLINHYINEFKKVTPAEEPEKEEKTKN